MRRNQGFNDSTEYWCDRNKKWKMAYPYTKFGVNRPKQTKIIERKLNFYFK